MTYLIGYFVPSLANANATHIVVGLDMSVFMGTTYELFQAGLPACERMIISRDRR